MEDNNQDQTSVVMGIVCNSSLSLSFLLNFYCPPTPTLKKSSLKTLGFERMGK